MARFQGEQATLPIEKQAINFPFLLKSVKQVTDVRLIWHRCLGPSRPTTLIFQKRNPRNSFQKFNSRLIKKPGLSSSFIQFSVRFITVRARLLLNVTEITKKTIVGLF